ncbi:inositol monophosphatase family protein [Streptomyces dysideae]|uniref:Uncharacterized protein n=1 Tax=Streptomyces dysideae TaxID=909626 RepID=A0A117RXF1_9ACTN|nr:inositol monophosphatase family protein [Streptomyces dysideae]KUO14764.1 hypothetical protein AQJ91_44960 [Streptomyces dysideae]
MRAHGTGTDPTELGAAGDREAQALIAQLLHEHRPGDAVLSEEAPDDPARLDADRVWIIDPLGGTREFAEPPHGDWAVQVALWEKDRLTGGAVALPARAVINKRAGGTGLITGRKAFQRPTDEGIELLHAVQDVYLDDSITMACPGRPGQRCRCCQATGAAW